MHNTFCQNGINYHMERSKRFRRLGLVIEKPGRVVVRLPFWLPEIAGHHFFSKNRNKVESFLNKINFRPNRSFDYWGSREDYHLHKAKAREVISSKVLYWNQFYGYDYGKISIKNQKTRWGSCSHQLNLNFNYKLIFLPSDMLNYVIVHELCHLKELNHSAAFWNLVSKTIPNYRQIEFRFKKMLV